MNYLIITLVLKIIFKHEVIHMNQVTLEELSLLIELFFHLFKILQLKLLKMLIP